MDEQLPNIPDPFTKEQKINIDLYKSNAEDIYWKFVDELEANFKSLIADARAGELNKTAALRARKTSIVLRKSLKEFRDISVAHDKMRVTRKPNKNTQLNDEINYVVECN